MQKLVEILSKNEQWLMDRVLHYAKTAGFTRYTSTLVEAWRLSIEGLSKSLISTLESSDGARPISFAHEDSELTRFAVKEAQLHRKRGVTLTMFLGLFKYYRESYLDLLLEQKESLGGDYKRSCGFIMTSFDKIEIAFCHEWVKVEDQSKLDELQETNRFLTNEKNAYLTVFESLSTPVILVSRNGEVVNYNYAAQKYSAGKEVVPGALYYQDHVDYAFLSTKKANARKLHDVFPWLPQSILEFTHFEMTRFKEMEFSVEINNKDYHFHATVGNMMDVSEKFTAFVITLNDVTQSKIIQKDLESSIDLKNKLFKLIAHDLLSPFHALLGLSDVLSTQYENLPDSEKKYSIDAISRQSKTLYEFCKNLLIWSQSQLESMSLHQEVLDLYSTIQGPVEILSLQAKLKGIKLENEIDKSHRVYADRVMLETIIRNIVANAIKFTREKGIIRVSSKIVGSQVKISVQDNGVGMSAEVTNKILNQSISSFTTTLGTQNEIGTGFGLKICSDFVHKNGGKIWIESKIDKGTTVIFTLNLG